MKESWKAHGLDRPGEVFKGHFGTFPTHLSRAPGRVNLIGEHTDYNGLPVFPMALRKEVRILFRPRDDALVRVRNALAEFPPRDFELSHRIEPYPPGDWGNYLKAACQALAQRLGPLRGLDALVSSSVPVASGLSSSSALVIAMAQALLAANELHLPLLELAEEMARAERYTGTQGGGMDQAIALGARQGHASRIEFKPLRLFHTPIPKGWSFVVAHTLARAEKSGPVQAAYNERAQSCREALALVSLALGGRGEEATESLSYRDLLLRFPVADLLRLGEDALPPLLFRRFRHVVTEAARVYAAEEAMAQGDLFTFGILMDASHESLRNDYEVSSPELDRLVELAREGGAAGARLTGAGFGGCMVALAHSGRAERVVASLAKGYFQGKVAGKALDEVLFLAEAGPGAEVTVL